MGKFEKHNRPGAQAAQAASAPKANPAKFQSKPTSQPNTGATKGKPKASPDKKQPNATPGKEQLKIPPAKMPPKSTPAKEQLKIAPQKEQPKVTPQKEQPKAEPEVSKKKSRFLLPGILAALVLGIGIVAVLLCMNSFKNKNDNPSTSPSETAPPVVRNQIRKDVYIAGINVGGLKKDEALELLMEHFPPATPPTTATEDQQEPVLSKLYSDKDMLVELYSSPEEVVLYQSNYDPSQEIKVDIYGRPIEETPAESTEESSTEEASESTETESTEETTEATEAPSSAPLTEDGVPYILDQTIVFPASNVDATLNLTAAVDWAYSIGREDGPEVEEAKMELDLRQCMTLNESYIRDVLDSTYEDILTQGTETLVEKTTTTLNDKKVDCLLITFGTKSRSLDMAALYEQIMEGYATGNFQVQAIYTEELPQPLDLDKIYEEQGCTMPVNAVCDPKTFTVTAEVPGYGFFMKDALELVKDAKPGDQVTLTLTELLPEHTKASMQGKLFSDVLGSCVSPHVYNPVRTKNLDLASRAINGTVLMPGQEFSYNRTVGERTAEKGYGEAAVYVGGRTENQLGGGVCQVASAIYYACLKANLKIVERYPHRYVPSYVPWGMDATIYWGSLDYRFVNNTAYPIRINVSVHDGAVYVELVGTETRDYTVKMDFSIIDENPASEKKVYIHPSMKDYSKYSGYKTGDVIQTAYDGYTVKVYMYKYDKNDKLISTTLVNTSKYERRDREVAHVLDASRPMNEQIPGGSGGSGGGSSSTKPTEPPTTESPTTAPPTTNPPTTAPPTTAPPTTEPPTTEPPTTEPPTTEPPTTEPPTTEPPTTEPPATDPPPTEASVTPDE